MPSSADPPSPTFSPLSLHDALPILLFGDPARMVRLDMSEYATYEAYERLIGQGANPGLLTSTVRERPFTVLLLDEIEKAHLNVFDLDRKSTRLNSSHVAISYAVFC